MIIAPTQRELLDMVRGTLEPDEFFRHMCIEGIWYGQIYKM